MHCFKAKILKNFPTHARGSFRLSAPYVELLPQMQFLATALTALMVTKDGQPHELGALVGGKSSVTCTNVSSPQ